MKCKEFQNGLFDYLEGKLPPEAQPDMDKHAGECLACASLLDRFNAMNQAILAEKSVEPNPFSHTRILEKLDAMKNRRAVHGIGMMRPALVTLGLIAALTAGFLIGNNGSGRKLNSERESLNIEQLRSGLFVQDFADEDITLIDND